MPSFDQTKAYAPQEKGVFFDDGREEELVEYVTSQPNFKNSPSEILKAMDTYGRTKKYLMNVGEDKGPIVTNIIRERKPQVMLELGGYCGYSTILFGEAMRVNGGKKYYSLERSPKFANIIRTLIEFAGLDDIVEVITGPSDESIQKLHDSKTINNIDMMFLDHYKPAYTTDLKLCESLGLISKGTILAADNVIAPGNPPYLKYVRSSVQEKRLAWAQERNQDPKKFHENWANQFHGHWANQYGSVEKLRDIKGNPNLIYESKLVEGWEPTGVEDGIEITRCLGEKAD